MTRGVLPSTEDRTPAATVLEEMLTPSCNGSSLDGLCLRTGFMLGTGAWVPHPPRSLTSAFRAGGLLPWWAISASSTHGSVLPSVLQPPRASCPEDLSPLTTTSQMPSQLKEYPNILPNVSLMASTNLLQIYGPPLIPLGFSLVIRLTVTLPCLNKKVTHFR